MGKFDEIRKIMKEFKKDMDSLANSKINEEQTARARLNPTALEEELASLDAEYDGHCQMQLDIIGFVLQITDPIMLKETYADTKVSYEKQIQGA